jgi:hypothetical protein
VVAIGGHVACMGLMEDAHKIFVGKPEKKLLLLGESGWRTIRKFILKK